MGVQGGSEVPEVTPTVQPASEFMYTLNSIAEAEKWHKYKSNKKIKKESDRT